MIAYNKNWLDNLDIHGQLDQAFRADCITKEELERGKKEYPVGFYSPHFFIRIGLFLLTIVISVFALAFILFFLYRSNGNEHTLGIATIILGVSNLFALEVFIRKGHFRSGVDDALLWCGTILIAIGLNLNATVSSLGNSIIFFLIGFICFLRYIDLGMSVVATIGFLGVFYSIFSKPESLLREGSPFIIMAVAITIYFLVKNLKNQGKFKYYSNCLLLMEIASLVAFYAAGNYYVVREKFYSERQYIGQIPFGWLIWFLTLSIPFAYIFLGIRKKDLVLMRTGLGLTAATIFTIRYYYEIMPVEYILLYGGILLMIISYLLMKYLKIPKRGFSSEAARDLDKINLLQIESLAITEIASGTSQQIIPETRFGGGSGGGGGAGGEF